MSLLTCHDGCGDGEDRGRDDVEDEVDPAGVVHGTAPNQGRHVISTKGGEVGENDLENGDGEDDEGRDDALTPPLAPCRCDGTVEGDLGGQATHDLKQADVEGRVEGEEGVGLKVTPGVTLPPRFDIVIAPYEGVDDGHEVENQQHDAEDGASKLSISPKETGRHPGNK